MVIALDPKARHTIWLDEDESVPIAERTTFEVVSPKHAFIVQTATAKDDPLFWRKTVAEHLRGWANLRNETGELVPCETKDDRATDDAIERLDFNTITELGSKIIGLARLGRAEKKD